MTDSDRGLIVHIERGDPGESRDLELSQAVMASLQEHYPNHYWVVSFAGGNLIIRHMLIAAFVFLETGKDGFGSLLPRNKIGTVQEVQHQARLFGGELLEAFKLPRGPWNGEDQPVVPQYIKRQFARGQQLRKGGRG